MVDAVLMNQAKRLDDADKLEMIYSLWDSIDHAERLPSGEMLKDVRQRAAQADAYPEDESSSDSFWAGIGRRYS